MLYFGKSLLTGLGAVSLPLNPFVIMPGLQIIALWVWPSCQVADLSFANGYLKTSCGPT